MEVTDEIRVNVAAQACLLWMSPEGDGYAALRRAGPRAVAGYCRGRGVAAALAGDVAD